jgi:tRNA-guanine family transglycosylase
MPADKPRYLMGVGKPEDIVEASVVVSICLTVSCQPVMHVMVIIL